MLPRERVLRAIEFQTMDGVPYQVEFTTPAREKMADYLKDPDFEKKIGNHLCSIKPVPASMYREVSPGFFEDDWKVVWNRTLDPDIGNPIPIMNEPHIQSLKVPDPVDPRRFLGMREFLSRNRETFNLLRMSRTLFERAWSLRGMENILSDMVVNPGFVDDLLDLITDFSRQLMEKGLEMDFDGVLFGDDYGWQQGVLMGPKLWRKFIKPRMAQLFSFVKSRNKKNFLHCCGKIQEILPDLVEIGLDGFNPFQPEVMDIFQIKRQYQGKLSFWGGISIQRLLPFGTPQEVRKGVKRILQEIGRNGGYIASPSHALPKDIPVENILALIETLQQQP
ncbi:MAG: hypothetical protein NTX88_03660 [Candidatus Atribacteria bacterium]|nr:hypothetical protein [Candidatus Atribacteria bacterium]